MKVKETVSPKAPNKMKKVRKSPLSEGSFSESLKEAGPPSEDGAVLQISGVAGVEGILAAQSSDATADNRRNLQRLMAYGDDLLDRLEDLRLGILLGQRAGSCGPYPRQSPDCGR